MADQKPRSRGRKRDRSSGPVARQFQEDSQSKTPLFCFRYTDPGASKDWAFNLDDPDSGEVLGFLREMAQLSWREIEALTYNGRKQKRLRCNHQMEVTADGFSADALKDLKKRKLDKTFGETMFRFRLASNKRLWGFRKDRIFHAVWWDPGHNVYPK